MSSYTIYPAHFTKIERTKRESWVQLFFRVFFYANANVKKSHFPSLPFFGLSCTLPASSCITFFLFPGGNFEISTPTQLHTNPHQPTHGFHGAGGGGGVGNMGGTAENIVFLSILALPSPDKATSAATNPAFPARVGSV